MRQKSFLMLIEDDELDQMLIKDALAELSIKNPLKIFNNGEHALEFLTSTPDLPFLILSDINMPKMSGIELKQEIEKDGRLKQKSVPFIFLTTSSSEKDIKQAYNLNAHGYFTKPSDITLWTKKLDLMFQYWTHSLTPKSIH
jgi:CheY-like chemotaxis protein